ncbi:MAG: hypothetical protein QOF76_2280 [Solirubrobacteraceae bacterium]|jgi:4-amino-4-deoxy-L-arabinose transferase-like glycosyltransferase|nr:hypothetical protein [Solirubrobacteraceae bacterium]
MVPCVRRWVLLVLIVALALRVLAIVDSDVPLYGDPADYDRIAVALADHGHFAETQLAAPGSASALRPPAYPLLVGAVYAVVGHHPDAARFAGALLGTLAVGLVYLLAAAVFGRRRALAAAGIAAVAPPLVWISNSLLAETLAVPLILATVLAILHARRTADPRLAAAAGLLLGLTVMTRTNTLALGLPLVVALWGARRNAGIALACVALVLTPWTIRNAAKFHRFLPLGTQSGYTIAGQWNDITAGPGERRAAWLTPQSVPAYADLFGKPGVDEGDIDAELRSRAVSYAVHHPGVPVKAFGLDLMHAFDLGPGHSYVANVSYREMGVPPNRFNLVRYGTYLLVLLAAVGLRRSRTELWLALVPVLLLASVVPWLGAPRYTVAVDPFLAILAAGALIKGSGTAREDVAHAAPSHPAV